MGTWSATVMGGDTPLDIEGMIYEACNIEMFPEEANEDDDFVKNEIPKELIGGRKAFTILDQIASYDDVAPMVLAVVMMRVGADMPKQIKNIAIKAAENDEWAAENDERKAYMDSFIKTVSNYDSVTPTDIDEEGLLDSIFKNLK